MNAAEMNVRLNTTRSMTCKILEPTPGSSKDSGIVDLCIDVAQSICSECPPESRTVPTSPNPKCSSQMRISLESSPCPGDVSHVPYHETSDESANCNTRITQLQMRMRLTGDNVKLCGEMCSADYKAPMSSSLQSPALRRQRQQRIIMVALHFPLNRSQHLCASVPAPSLHPYAGSAASSSTERLQLQCIAPSLFQSPAMPLPVIPCIAFHHICPVPNIRVLYTASRPRSSRRTSTPCLLSLNIRFALCCKSRN
jgi:hypothetical protein